ncbi:MAG: porin, partial [Muribaculaceae bacterium]|nr:porin [Muribaculaceae bacterium]
MKLQSILTAFLLFSPTLLSAKDSVNLIPEIHGVIRTRLEVETDGWVNRFQVRNARLNVGGKVAPVISYFVQFDACDRGKMTFLDAWGRFDITKSVYI